MRWGSAQEAAACVLTMLVAAVIASCGRGDASDHGTDGKAQRGGIVTLFGGEPDNLDPGRGGSFFISYAIVRPLYASLGASEQLRPDLADGAPQISADGRTVTVRLKRGIRYEPLVDREVVAGDVRYALERLYAKPVLSPGTVLLTDLVGVQAFANGRSKHIAGIRTPDPYTVQFRLQRPHGRYFAGLLSLPFTAPVPPEFARRFDRGRISTYDEHVVSTGPYRIGKYHKGVELRLERNPNWDPATDDRPAYLDKIELVFTSPESAGPTLRRIVRGHGYADIYSNADRAPVVRGLPARDRDLVVQAPGGETAAVFLKTDRPPLNDLNLRRAIIAGFDRALYLKVAGGPLQGEPATHFLAPGVPGYDQGGGKRGFGFDYLRAPAGDAALARSYLRRAGYRKGRVEGARTLRLLASPAGRRRAEVVQAQLRELGLRVRIQVAASGIIQPRCAAAESVVDICLGAAIRLFNDPESVLSTEFDGRNIVPGGYTNVSHLNVGALNRAMDRARVIDDPDRRARAWADIDRRVAALAPAVPEYWTIRPQLRSRDVHGVVNPLTGSWDLSWLWRERG